jgi:hypothetical protein
MLPKGLWKMMGADITQLKAILDVKLKMDDRKPLGFGRPQKDGKKKLNKFTSTKAMVFAFFTGMLYLFPILVFLDKPVMGLIFFYNLLLVLLSFALISDFSNVLIDTRDKLIIFPKPVDDKTIFLSRLLHIFIYFFRFVFPMSLPAWITFGIINGWRGAVIFPIPLLFLVLLCLFIVMGVYVFLLRITTPQRFKEILNFFQIAFTILIIACSYFLPRVMQSDTLQLITLDAIPWIKYVPSYWLAMCWVWVEPHAAIIKGTAWMSILAIVVPVACLWITVKFFAPSFMAKLSGLDVSEGISPSKRKAVSKGKLYLLLANMFNKSNGARAGFIITWLQSSRSRTFRMRVYPSIGFVPLYFVYLVTMNNQSLRDTWEDLPNTNKHLLLLYLTGFVIMNAINYITTSEQYKAAWVYYSSPVEKPGNILGGMFKAIWFKYYFPFIAIIGSFVVYVWGFAKTIDVLLAMVNVTLYVVCMMRINNRILPFSMPELIRNSGGKAIMRVFFVFALMGGLGFGHYIAHFWWLKLLFMALSSTFLWLVWDGYFNTDWDGIKKSEEAF